MFTSAAHLFFTHCRDELDAKASAMSYGRKAHLVRLAAIIAAAQAIDNDKVDWPTAVAKFKSIGNGSPGHAVSSHPTDFIKRWWRNLITYGNLDDAPRPGRPPLVPDEVAKRAAELIKQGQWVSQRSRTSGVRKQVLFRSIPQAIRALPELQQMLVDHRVTSDQLRHAMLRVDADLTQRTLHFKYAHNSEQLGERQAYAKEKLAWLDATIPGRTYQLDTFVWWDEGGVSISGLEHKAVRVWGSKAAMARYDVLHLPSFKGQKECKIHFIVAVSSHPAFARTNGLVYFEFTTGTTSLRRKYNTFGEDDGEPYEYRVSTDPFTYCVS